MLDDGFEPWTHKEILLLAQAALNATPEEAAEISLLIYGVIYRMDGHVSQEAYQMLLNNLRNSCVGIQ